MNRIMKDRRGDAVMVTSTLLLSLILSAGATMLLDYGEIKGKEEDMLHVTDVESSLLKARSGMEKLQENGDYEMVISSRITLGTYGSPYLGMARSSGKLSYDPSYNGFNMGIYIESGGSRSLLNSVNGHLLFESNNYYYRDQDLVFQGGGVIRKEETSSTMAWSPSIDVSRDLTSWSLTGSIYGLTGTEWSITGIESVSLSTSLQGSSRVERNIDPGDSVIMVYNGENTQAWETWWGSFAGLNGLALGVDIDITRPAGPAGPLEIELITLESIMIDIGEMEMIL